MILFAISATISLACFAAGYWLGCRDVRRQIDNYTQNLREENRRIAGKMR